MRENRNFSTQQRNYLLNKTCLQCLNMIIVRYYRIQGERIIGMPNFHTMEISSFAECPICYNTWPIYEDTQSGTILVSEASPKQLANFNFAELRQIIMFRFNLRELHTICFDIGIDYESIPDKTKDEFVIELILLANRKNILKELIEQFQRHRPSDQWDKYV